MNKPEVTVLGGKNSEMTQTFRGTKLEREPVLFWARSDSRIINHYSQYKTERPIHAGHVASRVMFRPHLLPFAIPKG